uniref:Cytochrome b561 domain-containing protein n=1 Tax=Corethron hystrix TaxID=216773 RepID=A0A7S1BEX3_9STRA|mmetsp:Transcript_25204/g.58228  ORF Transcript_25204/g.58228 Transcript_25204/m.58228 type:complete len:345 (+) Transcript_25204:124-1158(+)
MATIDRRRSPIASSNMADGGTVQVLESDDVEDVENIENAEDAEDHAPNNQHFNTVRRSLRAAAVLSLSVPFLCALWIHTDAMGGGLENIMRIFFIGDGSDGPDGKQLFNWHPLCMTISFGCMTISAVIFRVVVHDGSAAGPSRASEREEEGDDIVVGLLRSTEVSHESVAGEAYAGPICLSRKTVKRVHAALWTLALISGYVGIMAAYASHDIPGSYVANTYSLHSWIAWVAILVYFIQYISGLGLYLLPPTYLPFKLRSFVQARRDNIGLHRARGLIIYVIYTIVALLGIQEKEGFVGCAQSVTDKDPWWTLDIPMVCVASRSVALVMSVVAMLIVCNMLRVA